MLDEHLNTGSPLEIGTLVVCQTFTYKWAAWLANISLKVLMNTFNEEKALELEMPSPNAANC